MRWNGPLCLALLCSLTGLPPPEARALGQPQTTYEAVVGPARAQFRFPIRARATWTWNETGTRENAAEYQWSVEVTNAGREYQFGFVLIKAPGSRPAQGPLEALVRAGRQIVTSSVEVHHASSVPDARLMFRPESSSLVVTVEDPHTLELLFSSRPAAAVFRTKVPGELPGTRTVKIRYDEF